VKTVRTNAPISSAKLSAIMASENLDNMPGNARLAVSFTGGRNERGRQLRRPYFGSDSSSLCGRFLRRLNQP
jgi:hypothetical protein